MERMNEKELNDKVKHKLCSFMQFNWLLFMKIGCFIQITMFFTEIPRKSKLHKCCGRIMKTHYPKIAKVIIAKTNFCNAAASAKYIIPYILRLSPWIVPWIRSHSNQMTISSYAYESKLKRIKKWNKYW